MQSPLYFYDSFYSRLQFTLYSHLDHVSILEAEFTVTISDNSTVHLTKDCIADPSCASLYMYMVDCTVAFSVAKLAALGCVRF